MNRQRVPRRARSLVLTVALAIPLLALAGACSSSATPEPQTGVSGGDRAAAVPAPAADGSEADGGQGAAPGPTAGPAAPAASSAAGQFIVRTGTLELETKDVSAVLPKARDLIASFGGYVAGSDESNDGDRRKATITYRIPVDRWQDALSGLRGLADSVVREQTQAEEVTSQVVDLGARLDNLRASEASLREIMARAGTITDVLSVQEKLSEVRQQIEELTAQQQDLTNRAALATLAVSWETPIVAVAQAQSGWDLGHEIDHAAAQTIGAAQAAASALVWLVVVGIPVLGPVVILLLVAWFLMRRYARRHPRQGTWSALPPAAPPSTPAPSDPA